MSILAVPGANLAYRLSQVSHRWDFTCPLLQSEKPTLHAKMAAAGHCKTSHTPTPDAAKNRVRGWKAARPCNNTPHASFLCYKCSNPHRIRP